MQKVHFTTHIHITCKHRVSMEKTNHTQKIQPSEYCLQPVQTKNKFLTCVQLSHCHKTENTHIHSIIAGTDRGPGSDNTILKSQMEVLKWSKPCTLCIYLCSGHVTITRNTQN